MKLFLQNTSRGLIPMYDVDFDEKKKLKIGQVYSCEVRLPRNYEFHKKYFALINCAWEYQNEKRQEELFYNSIELFRKTVEITAGHCERIYSLKHKDFVEIPKSVSFAKMDNLEFQKHYDNVRSVLFSTFLTNISVEEFEKNLINF